MHGWGPGDETSHAAMIAAKSITTKYVCMHLKPLEAVMCNKQQRSNAYHNCLRHRSLPQSQWFSGPAKYISSGRHVIFKAWLLRQNSERTVAFKQILKQRLLRLSNLNFLCFMLYSKPIWKLTWAHAIAITILAPSFARPPASAVRPTMKPE
jgi:hypothetical protein